MEDVVVVSREQLKQALGHEESIPLLKLGEALLQVGLITREQLDTALERQRDNRRTPIGQVLLEMGVVTTETLRSVLVRKLGIPLVSLEHFDIDPEAVKLVPGSLAHKYKVLPLCRNEGDLVVAMEDPLRRDSVDEIRFAAGMKIVPVMASPADIDRVLGMQYPDAAVRGGEPDSPAPHVGGAQVLPAPAPEDLPIAELISRLSAERGAEPPAAVPEKSLSKESLLARVVTKIIADAVAKRASAIHIEPGTDSQAGRIRFRRYGSLKEYISLPPGIHAVLAGRVKTLAQLNLAERRMPQTGKLEVLSSGGNYVGVRVATVPMGNNAEDVVLLPERTCKPLAMENLGLEPDVLDGLRKLLKKPAGLLLVCGPAGSGRTTTLHALVSHLGNRERKIRIAEDRTGVVHPGVSQIETDSRSGLSFAAAIQSFARADSDVIVVGDMSDNETARVATDAAWDGRLLISAFRARSSPDCIARLLDANVDRFGLAEALLGVLALRVAHRLCPRCKHPAASEENVENLAREVCVGTVLSPESVIRYWKSRLPGNSGLQLFSADGCDACDGTGYQGELAIHEFLVTNPVIARLIRSRAPVEEILREAVSAGMRTLRQDGILNALRGETDLKQIRATAS